MADNQGTDNLGAIFKILSDANQQAQVESPYAAPLAMIGQAEAGPLNPLARNPYTGELQASPGMAALSGLATGLMRGIGQHLQNNYVANQNAQASKLMNQALLGQDIGDTPPEGMNPSVFSNIKNSATIFALSRAMQAAKNSQDMKAKAMESLFKDRSDLAEYYAKNGKLPEGELNSDIAKSGFQKSFLISKGIDPNAPTDQVKEQLKESIQNKVPAKGVGDLAHTVTVSNALDQLKAEIPLMSDSTFGDSMIGAAERTFKSYSLDTPEGRYMNKLNHLSDVLAKQFAGRTSWPSIEQQLKALTLRRIASKDALSQAVDFTKGIIKNEGEDIAAKFGDAGYNKLQELQDKGAQSESASSIDNPEIQADIQRLKNVPGITKEQAKQAINAKYGTNF